MYLAIFTQSQTFTARHSRQVSCNHGCHHCTNNKTDQATVVLLEVLRTRENSWKTKSETYKNRNVKRSLYAELMDIMKDNIPDIDLPSNLPGCKGLGLSKNCQMHLSYRLHEEIFHMTNFSITNRC